MESKQQQAGGVSGVTGVRELMMLVGILVVVAAGVIATQWVRAKEDEASAQSNVVRVVAPSGPRVVAPSPTPADGEAYHTDIYFDLKSTRLRADAVRILQEKATLMERASAWGVLVQGHADRQGAPEYNRALAQRRAEAVKQFLVELGVPEPTIKVVTIGQDGALCDDPGKECQQLNRRVHVEIRKLGRASAPVRPALAVGDVLDSGSTGSASPVTGREVNP